MIILDALSPQSNGKGLHRAAQYRRQYQGKSAAKLQTRHSAKLARHHVQSTAEEWHATTVQNSVSILTRRVEPEADLTAAAQRRAGSVG